MVKLKNGVTNDKRARLLVKKCASWREDYNL